MLNKLTFTIDPEEREKIEKWKKTLPKCAPEDNYFDYIFTSGGGIGYGIICMRGDGQQIDVTDVTKW
jgi:hypothetical protein